MTKSQLIRLLYYKNNVLGFKIISNAVNLILSEIIQCVSEQKKVEIRGFGNFSHRTRKEKTLLHPRTKELMKIAPYNTIHYSYSPKAIENL